MSRELVNIEAISFDLVLEEFSNIDFKYRIRFCDLPIRLPSGKEVGNSKDDLLLLLKLGNDFIISILYLGSSADNRLKFRLEESNPLLDEITDDSISDQASYFLALTINYLITSNLDYSDPRRCPNIIKEILHGDDMLTAKGVITDLYSLEVIYVAIIRKLDFSKLDPVLINRLRLGIAGHRMLSCFLKMIVEYPLEDNELDIRLEVLRDRTKWPFLSLHPGFRGKKVISFGSVNNFLYRYMCTNGVPYEKVHEQCKHWKKEDYIPYTGAELGERKLSFLPVITEISQSSIFSTS